jgi:hypothetical protein
MRRFTLYRLCIALVCAWLGMAQAWAGCSLLLCGAGGPAASVTYQGPGDIVSGAVFWGSCARVYNASLASTSTSLCDLVAVTGGAAVCTLRGSSTGFVDLAASYCAGTTPSAACAAASGGSCKVTKVYDQTGTTAGAVQATLANMPGLTFSGLGGLPVMAYVAANNSQLLSVASITLVQPFSSSAVYDRTGSLTTQQGICNTSAQNLASAGAANNVATIQAGGTPSVTATDSTWHAINAVFNGNPNTAARVDSTDNTGLAGGVSAGTGTVRLGRLTSGGALDGQEAECGMWPSGFTTQNRTDLNTNQHSLANGYNF